MALWGSCIRRINMKKILYSLLSIGVIGTIVVFTSNAFFSDIETSTGNLLEAGKIDLLVDSECTYNGQSSTECGTWDSKDLTSEKFFNFSDVALNAILVPTNSNASMSLSESPT